MRGEPRQDQLGQATLQGAVHPNFIFFLFFILYNFCLFGPCILIGFLELGQATLHASCGPKNEETQSARAHRVVPHKPNNNRDRVSPPQLQSRNRVYAPVPEVLCREANRVSPPEATEKT